MTTYMAFVNPLMHDATTHLRVQYFFDGRKTKHLTFEEKVALFREAKARGLEDAVHFDVELSIDK